MSPFSLPEEIAREIRYCEYKIILKGELLEKPENFFAFWKTVKREAKRLGVEAVTRADAEHFRLREITFFDTPGFAVYNNSFIIRKRQEMHEGFLVPEYEFTLKFRHPDAAHAASMPLIPRGGRSFQHKYKEEFLPVAGKLGSMRAVFSFNCVMDTPFVPQPPTLQKLAGVFPCLRRLPEQNSPLAPLPGVAIEEVQSDIGYLFFDEKHFAKADVAIWRNRADLAVLCGEFAFQCKFKRLDRVSTKALNRANEFYRKVQLAARRWVDPRATKTKLAYRLTGREVKNPE